MKAAAKIFLLLLCLLLALPLAGLAVLVKKPHWRDKIMQNSSRAMLDVIGVQVKVNGELSAIRPLLVVSNHISYVDVLILSSLAALRFTPKSDIASWPIINRMCRITGAIFINRTSSHLKENSDTLRQALANGEPVCLFPEGTTGNGRHMLPFKSSFFALAEEKIDGKELFVQPVALAYRKVRGLPIDTTLWHDIAWYGDMEMVPHLWQFLKITPIQVEVTFLAPITLGGADRKELSKQSQKLIQENLDLHRN